jgi:hypothetical protein
LQRLQETNEINGNKLNNIRRETSRHFRNKRREYLKDKFDELATKSKNKNIRELYRGINYFKKGYQPIYLSCDRSIASSCPGKVWRT